VSHAGIDQGRQLSAGMGFTMSMQQLKKLHQLSGGQAPLLLGLHRAQTHKLFQPLQQLRPVGQVLVQRLQME
jgi:hypothetical protein